uniref:Uncharacterized protein n=1 Tax=Mycobacterium sp. (strain JLS) TaxID=164757 RepID=A0A5Q5C9N2_MYCSJ
MDPKLDRHSLVVVGPDGPGKSDVVDAIDFALTDTVAAEAVRAGGVNLIEHRLHVHALQLLGAPRGRPPAGSDALQRLWRPTRRRPQRSVESYCRPTLAKHRGHEPV